MSDPFTEMSLYSLLEIKNARIEQLEAELAALKSQSQEPDGILHDDGFYTWSKTAPHKASYVGFRVPFYLAPPIPADKVLVDKELLRQISSSLGSFCGDEGWSQHDMDVMDNVDALIEAAKEG